MNWPIRTCVLFIFSLITLISCENPDTLGLDGVGTDVKLGTSYTDTITIKAATVLVNDSILAFKRGSTEFGHLITGQLSNDMYGTVAAKSFLELSINSPTIEGAAAAQIDSMVLALDYDAYYGDTTQALTLQVHQLQQPFKETETYFTTSALPYESSPIGSVTFMPKPLKKTNYVPTGSTTTITRSFPVRIPIANSVATQIIEQSGKTPLSTQAEFIKFLPGIALTATNNAKAALGFDLASDSTYLRIYYKSGGTKRTYDLQMDNGSKYFNNLSADRSNSSLRALVQSGDSVSATNTSNQAFLQESTGIKTKITFPYLSNLKQALGNVAINKAELVIPVVPTSGSTPSPYVYLFETNKNNKILRSNGMPRALSTDGGSSLFSYSSPFPASYSAKNNEYVFNMTSYVQAMLYDVKPNTGLIISPASIMFASQSNNPVNEVNALLNLQTLRQTVLNMAPGNKISLRIYYTTKK